jgi:outer membrane protein assembly factor BamB
MTIPYPLSPNRRIGPQKTCPSCSEIVPAVFSFCPVCSTSLLDVAENLRSVARERTQFQIPAYLLGDARAGRRYDYEGAGTGIIWFGLFLIAVPAATANLSPISMAAWIGGVVAVLAGLIRARADSQSMMRAGLLTGAAGVLALSVIANQIVRESSPQPETLAPATQEIASTDVAKAEEAPSESSPMQAMKLTGSVPMLRGSPAHAGVLPGPGPEGNPYRLWRFDAGDDLQSTPAIADATAYFGTRDGYLIALDLLTGVPRWRFDLGGYPVRAAPAVNDRTVYVGSGYSVFAIDAVGGEERWRFGMSYAGESSPVVVDGLVYVASKENHLYALDAKTGEKKWSYKTDGLLFGSPSISGDLAVIGGDDGDVFGLDRKTGRMIWKYTAKSGIFSTPAIGGNLVYVTSKDQTLIALDFQTGEEQWSYPVGGEASPAVVEDTVYVGSDDGAVYAFDANVGGPPLWLFATGNEGLLSPVVAGDYVYLAAGTSIFKLDRATGEKIWQYPVGDKVTVEPVVLDGIIYVGAADGFFYAIGGDAAIASPVPNEST